MRNPAPRPDTPPLQDELTANWGPDAPVAVSICSITFNHADFIADALDGMLSQRHPDPYEIIIQDDVSTDGTREIVQDYARRYPRIIRPVLPERNRYSQGLLLFPAILPMARGRYVALCEGDDYWIGSQKLAAQSNFLDAALDCSICSHQFFTIRYDAEGATAASEASSADPGRYDAAELFEKRKATFPTASIMMRREAIEDFLTFADKNSYIRMEDIFMKFFAARSGGIELLPGHMAAYRAYAPNSWSSTMRRNMKFKLTNARAKVDSFRALLPEANNSQRQAIKNIVDREIDAFLRDNRLGFRDRFNFARDTGLDARALRGLIAAAVRETLQSGSAAERP